MHNKEPIRTCRTCRTVVCEFYGTHFRLGLNQRESEGEYTKLNDISIDNLEGVISMAYHKGKSFLETFGGNACDVCFSAVDVNYNDDTKSYETEDFGGFYLDSGVSCCFLTYLFEKYYNPKMKYNRELYGPWADVFDWNGNFLFSYEQIRKICSEIEHALHLFKCDYYNPELDAIKRSFSIYSMCDKTDPDYINGNNDDNSYKRHLNVILEFYEGFLSIMQATLSENPNQNFIEVSGP